MPGDIERDTLARYLLGDRLTPEEADCVAAALIPGRMKPVDRPFETLEEGRQADGTAYRIKAVQIYQGDSVALAIEGHGGTATSWLLRREHLVRLLEICDGE